MLKQVMLSNPRGEPALEWHGLPARVSPNYIDSMPACYLALGGNLGPVRETLDRSLAELRLEPHIAVVNTGSYFRTSAVGEQGAEFLNSACEIATDLAPLELLERLQSVETRLGRMRERHWGPRTLDLDLLFYGSEIFESPRLTVPHPACWYRRFVLDPLVEIAADFIHPVKQISIRELHARLLRRPMRVALAGGLEAARGRLVEQLRNEFPSVEFAAWEPAAKGTAPQSAEPTFIVWLGSDAEIKHGVALDHAQPDASSAGAPSSTDFQTLPLVPRIDATSSTEPPDLFVKHLLQSALG